MKIQEIGYCDNRGAGTGGAGGAIAPPIFASLA